MEAADTTEDPSSFLREVRDAHPGWSTPRGGPEGVARHIDELQQVLRVQAQELAAVRAAALQELLQTHSLAEVADMFGVTRPAVYKAIRSPAWKDPRW